jgi:hypothetical protein
VGTGYGQAALVALGLWGGGALAQEQALEDEAGEVAVLRAPEPLPAERRPPALGLFGRAHLGAARQPLAVRVDGSPAGRAAAQWADLPVPEAAVDRVQVRAGAGDAEQMGFRPTLLVETLRAENALTARSELRWAPAFLAAAPSAAAGGSAAVEGTPDAPPPDPAWRALRASLALGGPLVPDLVALTGSAQLARRAHRAPDLRSAPSTEGSEQGTLRLTFGARPGTRVTLGLLIGHARREPLCRRCDAASAGEEESSEASLSFTLEQPLGPVALLLLASGGVGRTGVGPAAPSSAPSHTDLSTGWTSGAPGRLAPDVPWSRVTTREQRGDAHLRLAGGDGVLGWKAGLQLAVERGLREGAVPGGMRFLDDGAPCTLEQTAGCLARVAVSPGTDLATSLRLGAYAQLAWTPLPPLTVWLALRLDAGRLSLPGGPSPWLTGLGPRATLAWDVAGSGRHVLVLHAGRAHEVGDLALAFRAGVQPLQRVALFDAPGAGFADCSAPGPRCLWSGGVGGTAWAGLPAPQLDEVAAGYQAVLSTGVRAGVDATLAWVDGLWQEEERNRVRDAAGALAGSVDGTFRSVRQVGTARAGWHHHQAVDAWLVAHPGSFDARLGYILSWTSGSASQPFDDLLRDVPQPALAQGFLPSDRRHLLQAAGEVEVLAGLFLGARLRYATGSPLWQTVAVASDPGMRVPLTARGTAAGSDGKHVAVRNPDSVRLDLEVRANLSVVLGLGAPEVELAALVVNALGAETPTLLSVSPGHVGAVLARQAPRHAELRLRVAY